MTLTRRSVCKTIRGLALSLPETYEDEPVELTVKLSAEEREIAHLHPWVRRASHVGRYGWVTATIEDDEALETALEWLRESYYLKAPATLRDAAFAE